MKEPMFTCVSAVLRSCGRKVIFVGDASMSPYEISQPGGSVG